MSSIPITEGASESAGKLVAEVRVDERGNVEVVSIPHNADLEARIEAGMRAHRDLSFVTFRAPQGPVQGWKGFWGMAFALRLAMPTVGLSVDWGNMEGPTTHKATPDFIILGSPEPEPPMEWLPEGDDNTAAV
jgi:hypothetical protein